MTMMFRLQFGFTCVLYESDRDLKRNMASAAAAWLPPSGAAKASESNYKHQDQISTRHER